MSKRPTKTTTRANNKSRRAAPPAAAGLSPTALAEVSALQGAVIDAAANPKRIITGGSEYRKGFPMARGLFDYFPDALALVSNVSYVGNMKHNPGEEMHHARGKSMDHADCIARHLLERGGYDIVVVDGVQHVIRHSAALAWRALALLQEELEAELDMPLPRGAKLPSR